MAEHKGFEELVGDAKKKITEFLPPTQPLNRKVVR